MNRLDMARQIVEWERRNDAHGRIRLYRLPANDGGGKWEYGGINDRYHPAALTKIRRFIGKGQHNAAEQFAVEYIAKYTDALAGITTIPAVEMFLRDSAWNRGPTGAKKILQIALGVKPDGHVGPITRGAVKIEERIPLLFLSKLRKARETYENIVAPGRANLRKGMINRWDKALAKSTAILSGGSLA